MSDNTTENQPVNPFHILQEILNELTEAEPNYRKTTQKFMAVTHGLLMGIEQAHQKIQAHDEVLFQISAGTTALMKALEDKNIITPAEMEAAADKYVRKPMEAAKLEAEEAAKRVAAEDAGIILPDEKTIITP
jgi:hypothetical protein